MFADSLSDDCVCVVAHLSVRHEVVGADEVARIDIALWNELIDFDGACGFERDILQFVLRHFNVGISVDLVTFDDVLG
jgi:hypothetical protein